MSGDLFPESGAEDVGIFGSTLLCLPLWQELDGLARL
jgi:hypothetical protein